MATLNIPKLFPKQVEFVECLFDDTTIEVAYGGAKGGGKSFVTDIGVCLLAVKKPGVQILLVRKTLQAIQLNHVPLLTKFLRDMISNSEVRFAKTDLTFYFKNGSKIVLGYCDSGNSIDLYQGQSWDYIFMDEAAQFIEKDFQDLFKENRKSGLCDEKYIPKFICTFNPGNIWVKKRYVDPIENRQVGNEKRFIRATIYDNDFIMINDPNYVKKLEALPEKERKKFLEGDFEVSEGQFFSEFDPNKHVIEPFPIPSNWKVYRGRDYGLDMCAVLWVAVDEYGAMYCFEEFHQSNLTIQDACPLINVKNKGRKIIRDLAPPDCFARTQADYRTKDRLFLEYGGHFLEKVSDDRETGFHLIHECLQDMTYKRNINGRYVEVTHPRLRFFSNCVTIIENLPQIQIDKNNPRDCAKKPHEITHIVDALRYICVSNIYQAEELRLERQETDNWLYSTMMKNGHLNNSKQRKVNMRFLDEFN